ncbi:MAG: flagellar filament capping protein FliD [Aliarcobacter sp.]|jgi:flagellar hook-associated protein 2|nr:flagellar filament capping protein FliD [Aliarcobacter sp.]
MAEGVLGLGSGQAASLNNDLIDKLKTAERKSTVAPYETSLEDLTLEKEVFATVSSKVTDLLSAIKPFDLFVTGGATVFDQKSATTSGDSVTFDAADVSALNKGVTTVNIISLAQKDVYQSNEITDIETALTGLGDLTIGSETFTTEGKTYKELASEINAKSGMNASLEQVGTNKYRLVLKSEESGLDNALVIGGAASNTLGFDVAVNHTLSAKNLEAEVDGVAYSVSTNNFTVDGLKISAAKEGVSSINIVEDSTSITTAMEIFITNYNELVTMIDDATDADSPISDKSGLRDILSQIKDKLFGSYGESNDKSFFNFGLELDKSGTLSLDTTIFNKAIEDDIDGLKDLFVGTAENEGLGTQLKSVFDEMSFTSGILSILEDSMTSREATLNEEKEKAEETLNSKYEQLSLQFASYGTIITQFESSFSGLKLLIEESTSS